MRFSNTIPRILPATSPSLSDRPHETGLSDENDGAPVSQPFIVTVSTIGGEWTEAQGFRH